MSFALLGNIAFDVLNAPSRFDERHSAQFAEHAVLVGKPRLQAMNMGLSELNLTIQLHHSLGEVESRYQALKTAQASQEALALVWGLSQFVGHFVITELSSQTLIANANGEALAREISLSLKECVGDFQQGIIGQALALGGQSPLASVLPKGVVSGLNQAKSLIEKGVKIYRQAQRAVSEVKQAVAVIKSLKENPMAALAQLPFVVNTLGSSLNGLSEAAGLKALINTGTLSQTANFFTELSKLGEPIYTAYTLFKQGLDENRFGDWFDLGVKAVDEAAEMGEALSQSSAKLTASLAIRLDNQEAE